MYPALAVIQALLEAQVSGSTVPSAATTDLLWIGSRNGIEEEMVRHAGVEFVGLAAGGLRGMGVWTAARNAVRIAGSVAVARSTLAGFRPDAVLATGGYACVSVTLAARTRGVPVLIYLPDIVPGLAIRFLSRVADKVAVTSEQSYQYFRRGKAVATGYPVRREIMALDRAQARLSLGLDPDATTLLVFGGSRGARSINRALVAGLPQLLPTCQVIHVSGRMDAGWIGSAANGLNEGLRTRYHHYAYLHDMPSALVAADLAVARAGAATMGEFPAAGLPAILVPYPYSGQHQLPNANYMAENGAARVLPDAELDARLVSTILEMMSDRQALADMREAARAMARPYAAQAIAEQLWLVARRQPAQETGV